MTIQLCSIKNSLLTPGFGRNFMQIKKSCRRSWLRRLWPPAARLPRTLNLFRGHTSEEEGPVQCGRGRGPKTRRWGRGRDGEQPAAFPGRPLSAWPAGGGRALHQGLALSRGGVSPVTSLQRQSRTVTNEGLVIAGSFPRAGPKALLRPRLSGTSSLSPQLC